MTHFINNLIYIYLGTENHVKPVLDLNEPSLPEKYKNWPKNEAEDILKYPYLASDWPTAVDCAAQVSKKPASNEYPTVFLSPESKGFK